VLGLACVGIGLLAIGVAWNGAAGKDYTQGQIPYLISGGGIGVGLIILGAAMIVVENNRRDRMHLEAQLRELTGTMGRLAAALGSGAAAGNGSGPTGAGPMVVLGSSSYHRPDCRLAQGKNLPAVPVSVAEAEGLTPCRICQPEGADALAR
jgi:hypothetical protein